MSRELLFRGKRKDNSEWVEGYYYESKISGCFILVPKLQTRKKDGDEVILGESFDTYEVIPETVGQSTGLLDKNNTKIYEGDIVEFNNGDYIGVITWCENCASFLTETDGSYYLFDRVVERIGEVIGNKFDNNDLLQ